MIAVVQWIPAICKLKDWVFTQMITVVCVFITTGHLQNSLDNESFPSVVDVGWVTLIINGVSQSGNNAAVKHCFTYQQSAKIRG